MSVHSHKQEEIAARCMVVTVSDSRDEKTDKSGKLISDFLTKAGHEVIERKIIPDEKEIIKNTIEVGCNRDDIDVILTSGGTGISYRDVTIETVDKLFDKHITGFGELFRMLSYTEDIGSAAIMSRATAGLNNHTAIFAMPGSSGAVKLAMEKLIIPELSHVLFEIGKHRPK